MKITDKRIGRKLVEKTLKYIFEQNISQTSYLVQYSVPSSLINLNFKMTHFCVTLRDLSTTSEPNLKNTRMTTSIISKVAKKLYIDGLVLIRMDSVYVEIVQFCFQFRLLIQSSYIGQCNPPWSGVGWSKVRRRWSLSS